MILLEVRDQLKSAGRIPTRDLAAKLGIPLSEATTLLEYWVKKGLARKLPPGTACIGSCTKCSPDTVEIYEWLAATLPAKDK